MGKEENAHLRKFFESIDLELTEYETLWNLLDIECAGVIKSDDFLMSCLSLVGNAKALEMKSLFLISRQIFLELQALSGRGHRQSGSLSLSLRRASEERSSIARPQRPKVV